MWKNWLKYWGFAGVGRKMPPVSLNRGGGIFPFARHPRQKRPGNFGRKIVNHKQL
jgi:hypothetical protein